MIPAELILVQGATSVRVLPQSAHDLTQDYAEIGASGILRLGAGAALKQTLWTRLSTRVSGRGGTPPALTDIDWRYAFVLHCVSPRALVSAGLVFALPAARRVDLAPCAVAIVDDRLVPTALALAGDTATVTAVPGASGYRVLYWPVLSVVAVSRPAETGEPYSASYGWELEAQEV